MTKQKISKSFDLAGKTLTLETGELASQATASILARLGDTMILVTMVVGEEREDLGYFPLMVEYVERLYAGGRIKGSRWVKREGRPSDDAILSARLIDRSIRPLFPKDFKKEVQIVVTTLSVDGQNEPDVLAIIATSAALSISSVPWKGPVSATRIGFVKDKENDNWDLIVNPGTAEQDFSDLDLVASQSRDKTLMIEAEGSEVPEDTVIKAIERAQVENARIIDFIEEFAKEAGVPKEKVSPKPEYLGLIARLEKSYKKEIIDLSSRRAQKEATPVEAKELIDKIFEEEQVSNPDAKIDKKSISKALEDISFGYIREQILTKKVRPDGRGPDDLREISGKVSVLPRTHGSAVFQRGDTQVLTVVTLGSPRMEQLIESAEGEESKRYIHHYSMPPYSVGETGRIGYPSRREIGHGALAEKAIVGVIPKHEKFPYTIRVVSEVMSSNGSTSMASTCGSALALMDSGVPINAPVAGISIGMMSRSASSGQAGQGKGEDYVLLTDILGLEDFSGDMDFKVAGTETGVTAIQLDVKVPITPQQIVETFDKARKARLAILKKMLAILPKSREELSQYAPKIEVVKIPQEKIGEIIGPGGRVIRNIIAETGATVDVNDDGEVTISGTQDEQVKKAMEWVTGLVREVAVGEEFEGQVKRILPFGAFVEFLPGKEGMVHVSKMSTEYVNNPNDVVSIGQKVKVRVAEVDDQGRINLSMLSAAEEGEKGRGGSGGGDRGGPDRRGSGGGRSFSPRRGPSDRPPVHRAREEGSSFGRRDDSTPQTAGEEAHPLVRQFRREQGGSRDRNPRFKKAY